jgi:tripartite motif-containing protein 71
MNVFKIVKALSKNRRRRNRVVFFVSIFFVAGFLLCANSVSAASFNDAANGNWNIGTTWGNGCASSCVEGTTYPGPNDSVTINSNTVTLSANQSSASTTIATGGTLSLSTFTLNVYGNFIHTGGTFNANTGTVNLVGTGQTVSGVSTFYNLTKATTTISDNLYFGAGTTTVSNTLTLTGSGSHPLTVTGTSTEYSYYNQIGNSYLAGGMLNYPTAITIDATGNTYVSEYNNHRISKFDSSGNFVSTFGSYGSGNGQLSNPRGIVVATSTGNTYVYDSGNSRMEEFNSSGNYVGQWGSSGTTGGKFTGAYGVAIDLSNNIYVADSGNNRIQKFDSSGNFVWALGWGVATGASTTEVCTSSCRTGFATTSVGGFNSPKGVAIATSSQYIYVADTGNNRIETFDPSGNYVSTFGSAGSGNGQFSAPAGIIVATSTGNIYVFDSGHTQIQKFNSSGTYVAKWGSSGTGNGQFEFNGFQSTNPYSTGIALDSSENVYVVDPGNYRVQKFNLSGTYVSKFGTNTSVNGTLSLGAVGGGPTGVAISTSTGYIYVADIRNSRIQVFNSSGAYVTSWGSSGSGNGQFNTMADVRVGPSGNIYVFDNGSGVGRVQKFTSSGTYITSWLGASGAAQISGYSLAVDSNENIYITDTSHNRILKFDSSGNFILMFGWDVNSVLGTFQICTSSCLVGTSGSGNGQFSNPRYVAVDSSNNVYVSDYQNSRVEKFDSSGNFIANLGAFGHNFPYGVAFDQSGNMIVAGMNGNKVNIANSALSIVGTFGAGPGTANGVLAGPNAIATDLSGNVFVVNTINERIEQFHTSWFLASTGTTSASNVIMKDSSNGGSSLTCTDCTNNGYNTGWSFQSSSLPTVSASTTTSIATTSATFNGSIDATGGSTPTIRGFDYGTTTAYGYATSTSGSYSMGSYSATSTNLVCGTTYHFMAFATNQAGTGTSTDATFTTSACLSSPQALVATAAASASQVTLTWSVPVSNGGSAITDYLVEYKQTVNPTWLTFNDGVSTLTSATVTGLTASTSYDFRVSAVNAFGTSTPSATSTVFAGMYSLSAGPYTVQDLGTVLSTNSIDRPFYFQLNGDTHFVAFYEADYGTSDFQIVDVDMTQGTAQLTTGASLGRLGSRGTVLYPNGKIYIASAEANGLGYFSEYNPSTHAVRQIAQASGSDPGQYDEIGDDGWIYIGGFPNAVVDRYNPNTDTYQRLGSMDANADYSYTLGADTRYLYVGLGENPWSLAVYDTQTQAITNYWGTPGDTFGSVRHGTNGNWYYMREGPTTSGLPVWYQLTNGAPVLLASPPSGLFVENAQRGNVVDGVSNGYLVGYNVNLDNALPDSSNNNATIKYQTVGSSTWQSVTVSGFHLIPMGISRLFPWDSTHLLAFSSFYGPALTWNVNSHQSAVLGYPQFNLYDYVNENNIAYFSGYTAAQLRYDPSQPWTLTASTPNKFDTSVNPYQTHVVIGKHEYWEALGSDGMVYVGSQHQRDSVGGEIGWYNPSNGTTGSLRTPFLTDDINDMKPALGGTKLVYASQDPNLFVFDVASKSVERTIVPLPGINMDKVVEVAPGIMFGVASSTIFEVNITNGSLIYSKTLPGQDAIQGKIFGESIRLQDRRLVLGPDGFIWMFVWYRDNVGAYRSSLYRINPTNGVSAVIVANTDYTYGQNNVMFNGGDMYWYLGTHIYHIGGLLIPPGASLPQVSASAASPVSAFAATLNGSIDNIGGSTPTIRGFNYSISTTTYDFIASTTGSYSTGPFTTNLTGLTCATTYRFRAYAINSSGTGASGDIPLTTSACPATIPTVSSSAASPVSTTTATLNGSITVDGTASSTIRGFNYGLTTAYGTIVSTTGTYGVGSFTSNLTGLSCATTFHFEAFATNPSGTAYSSDSTFTTNACSVVSYNVSAPTGFIVSSISSSTISLSWNVANADLAIADYNIYRGGNMIASLNSGTTFTDTGLSVSTGYSYVVTAVDTNSDESSNSNTVLATTTSGVTSYTVGGNISGLSGTVVLQNNSGDNLSISANGSFTFATSISDGNPYSVTVLTQPSGQTCSVSTGSGTVSAANVTSISVTCTTNTVIANSGGGSSSSGGGYAYIPFATTTPTIPGCPIGFTCTLKPVPGCPSGFVCTVATTTTPIKYFVPTLSTPSEDLTLGSRGSAVVTLQNFLISQGDLGSQYNTGYFGALTQAALAKYQSANGITPASGYFGPITRAFMERNDVLPSSNAPTTPLVPANPLGTPSALGIPTIGPNGITFTVPTNEPTSFTRDLTLGSTGSDVKQLQMFLNSKGFTVAKTGAGSPGQESTYFGPLTQKALAKFQKANGITPAVGYFGPITRSFINTH